MVEERHFVMRWPELDISIECKALPYNRGIYDWWLDHMPIKAVQSHAAVTGEVMYTLNVRLPEVAPVFSPGELKSQLMTEAPIGIGRFSSNQRGSLSGGRVGGVVVVYGPLTEAMPAAYCFQVIEEDIKKLKEAGLRIWNAVYKTKDIITVELSVKK